MALSMVGAVPAAAQSYDDALFAKNKAVADGFLSRVSANTGANDSAVVYNLQDPTTKVWSKTDRVMFAGAIKNCTQTGTIKTMYAGATGPKYGVFYAWNCGSGRQLATILLVAEDAVYRVDIAPESGQ